MASASSQPDVEGEASQLDAIEAQLLQLRQALSKLSDKRDAREAAFEKDITGYQDQINENASTILRLQHTVLHLRQQNEEIRGKMIKRKEAHNAGEEQWERVKATFNLGVPFTVRILTPCRFTCGDTLTFPSPPRGENRKTLGFTQILPRVLSNRKNGMWRRAH